MVLRKEGEEGGGGHVMVRSYGEETYKQYNAFVLRKINKQINRVW